MYSKTYRVEHILYNREKEIMKDANQRTISGYGLLFCFTCLDFYQ